MMDSVDLDEYYCPFAIHTETGEIHWFSPVTNEIVLIQRFVGHA